MKKFLGGVAAMALVFAASAALAANTVNVTGDLAKDGNLLIDVNWTIDTAKYKGASREEVQKQVYEEIWKQTLPKLVKKSQGLPVSFEKSNFTKLTEQKNLVEQRTDGTKVIDYNARVKFICPIAVDAAQVPAKNEKAQQETLEKSSHYNFVREGID